MIVDSVHYINKAYGEGKRIMVEGANATMLDIDFGTWPYVTSSNASIGGAVTGTPTPPITHACVVSCRVVSVWLNGRCGVETGLGLAPSKIDGVIGIVKAYTTRVGAGPFPTELKDDLGESIRKIGHEFGTTTGRPRRCGWLDAFAIKYATTAHTHSPHSPPHPHSPSSGRQIRAHDQQLHAVEPDQAGRAVRP